MRGRTPGAPTDASGSATRTAAAAGTGTRAGTGASCGSAVTVPSARTRRVALMNAPSVSAGNVRRVRTTVRMPSTTRSATSTTSSPGRRPFGKPALSPPMTPRRFCAASGVGAMLGVQPQHLGRRDVLRLVQPGDAGQEHRDEVGARRRRRRDAEERLDQHRQRRMRHVLQRTARRLSARCALNLSLSGKPMTTSFTSGWPSRDTCVNWPAGVAPPTGDRARARVTGRHPAEAVLRSARIRSGSACGAARESAPGSPPWTKTTTPPTMPRQRVVGRHPADAVLGRHEARARLRRGRRARRTVARCPSWPPQPPDAGVPLPMLAVVHAADDRVAGDEAARSALRAPAS